MYAEISATFATAAGAALGGADVDFEWLGVGGGFDDDDVLEVPDGVWDAERNNSKADTVVLRQSNPPSTGCLNIRLIYNNGWVQSSASGNSALARQRALDVLAEAESIYNKSS